MKVSVVIPTLNEEGVVGKLLSDLGLQTYQVDEVIVVDGGSEDKTHKEVKNFKNVKLVVGQRGVARQRNHGGRLAGGEIVIFMDADTRIKPDFLEQTIRHFEQKKLDVAGMWYLPTSGRVDTTLVMGLISMMFSLVQKVSPSASGTGIVVRKAVFDDHGGFDEQMRSFEDMEFVARVGKKNKFGVLPIVQRISDRRFRKYGFFRTTGKYMLLSLFFMIGKYHVADKLIYYEFGKHLKFK